MQLRKLRPQLNESHRSVHLRTVFWIFKGMFYFQFSLLANPRFIVRM